MFEKSKRKKFYKSLLQEKSIHINRHYFDNDELNKLLHANPNIEEIFLQVDEQEISEENLQYLQEHLINGLANLKQISSNRIFECNTVEDIQTRKEFTIHDFEDKYLNHLKYILPGTTILISDSKDNDKNLNIYFTIINQLEKLGINSKVIIDETLIDSEKLKQSEIFNLELKNIQLYIKKDFYEYSIEEYLKEDEKLELLVKDIKNSDMSSYEQYLAVYNIVKHFKPYKETSKNRNESRYIRYILDNEYIVCVGFANLLQNLLKKVGIESYHFGIKADTSYDKGFTEETKKVNLEGHQRILVNLKDPKYNIDGYYIADPTWDNIMDKDIYVHSAMTIEETTKETRLQALEFIDYIFNVNSMDEFNQKVNILINKKIMKNSQLDKKIQIEPKTLLEEEISALREIYKESMEMIRKIDYYNYKKLLEKYNSLTDYEVTKQDFYNFLTDFGHLVIDKNNNPISSDTLLNAAANMQIQLGSQITEEQLRQEQIVFQNNFFKPRQIENLTTGESSYINEENKFKQGKSR